MAHRTGGARHYHALIPPHRASGTATAHGGLRLTLARRRSAGALARRARRALAPAALAVSARVRDHAQLRSRSLILK